MESLLEQLQNAGLLTADQARVVSIECAARQVSAGTVLKECDFVPHDVMAKYGKRDVSIDLKTAEFVPDDGAVGLLDESIARRFSVLPVSFDAQTKQLTIAIPDLSDVIARDTIKRNIPKSVGLKLCEASAADINRALDKCYGYSYTLSAVLSEMETVSEQLNSTSDSTLENRQAPVSRLIDTVLQEAITRRASDIHLSPEKVYVRIRFRVDGVLNTVCCIHISYWPAMLVRIKVLSDLDIAETRQPQDGYLGRIIHGEHVDFRVASFPLNNSENLVLRVLDRRQSLLDLSALCSHKPTRTQLEKLIARPSGLVLVCGPTGAGKTTSLYALLRSLNAESLNIMTLEDPVEFPVANISQTRVNGNSALDFAQGVRGVLRQDPDVILVGEIRDADSCAMCCRAALTGHLVLTSTHADSAIGAISRLLELGVSRAVLASVLVGVVSQRLFRKVCSQCEGFGADCRACRGSGFSGRLALFECLTMSEEFSSQLHSGAPMPQLREVAIGNGLVPLEQQAKDACIAGLTSADELTRVLGDQV